MRKRTIVILCLAIFCGTPNMSAQSFLNKVKKAAKERVEREVKKVVPGNSSSKTSTGSKQSAKSRALERQADAMVGKGNNKNTEDQAPTVRLPKTHTALFAPLGYDIEAKYGVKKAKPVAPPKDADAQVPWSDKLPDVQELDNQSLVDEFLLLNDCVNKGIIKNLTPADWRFRHLVMDELRARCDALDKMVEKYNETVDEYKDDDAYNWIINGLHRDIAAVLDSRAYKTLIRSSITPLFSVKDHCVNEKTKTYFKAHGGYENATKVKMTVWNPEPNRKRVSTSESGKTAEVLSENASGAKVDMDGVTYVLHNKGKSTYAFISEAATTAVAGKALVIPDYVTFNGKRYPVRGMRAGVFRGKTIKSIKLPSTLQEIPNGAFRETPITEITIPASVNIVQGSAFYGCKKLAKVVFEGNSMKELHGCFQNCISLASVKLPNNVGLMSYDMFAGCINLMSVTLPQNITQIYKSMFKGCTKLKTVAIPRSVTKIEGAAFANSGIAELDVSGVKEFGLGCFSGCKSLKSLKLNASLKANFVSEIYTEAGIIDSPFLQVKYVNDQYVIPAGITFIGGR